MLRLGRIGGRWKLFNYKFLTIRISFSKNFIMPSLHKNLEKLQNTKYPLRLKGTLGKKIAIFGLGIENYFLCKFLLKNNISCKLLICDFRDKDALGERFLELSKHKNISWKLNKISDKDLDGVDIVFRSPGWPLFDVNIKNAKQAGAVISSPIELFFDLCPTRNIIGVTGTKGKGTTSSLIFEILKTAGKTAYLGGNIGVAPFSFLEKIKKDDYVVLELSSFQLESLQINLKVAVITNFSREHLKPADPNNPNHHKTLEDYFMAKASIVRFQTKNNFAVINENLKAKIEDCFKKYFRCRGKRKYFAKSDLKSQLIGEHNKENIAAAVETAKILKINKKYVAKAVANFKGLEYRIEFITEKSSINFYNDSFATTPDATITALKSFAAPVILLAGGADKGNDFKKMAKEIKKRVKFLILFQGEGSSRLKHQLRKLSFSDNKIAMANNRDEAIKTALTKTDSGDVVLLSPGCASFGVFKNYKERGRLFREKIKKI